MPEENLSQEKEDSRNKISAGSYDLNRFLLGGYEKDIITTIYGPAGSGKTNFCVLAAVSQAKKGKKVIFIDSEGGFSVERIKQILSEEDNLNQVLKNIILLKPTNFNEQKESFNQLLKEIKSSKDIGLIIVDGMTMLYRLELAENKAREHISKTNSELAWQMRCLAEISRKNNLPVIVTNQVYLEFLNEEDFKAGKEREVFMVGGDILKYWSKCILELKNEKGRRVLIIKKHRSIGEKKLEFEIINKGIRKKGWL